MTDKSNPKAGVDTELDAFFDAARQISDNPPEALMARVLADAEAMVPPPIVPVATRSWGFAGILRDLGGWPAIAGFAAASVVGLAIGLAPPEGLAAFEFQQEAFDLVDLVPDYGFTLEEGG